MITYQALEKRLAEGHLKNTSAVDNECPSEIVPAQRSTVLNLVNQGLQDLSTRMPIIKGRVDLTFSPLVRNYLLSQTMVGQYLSDTGHRTFTDIDFVKIFALETVEDGCVVIHPHDTNGHITTPTHNSLRFSSDIQKKIGDGVSVVYQAKHQEVLDTDTIDIPSGLEIPLQLFVGSLFLSHMNGAENSAKGDSYFGAYLRYLNDDMSKNTSNTSEVYDTFARFEARGFV